LPDKLSQRYDVLESACWRTPATFWIVDRSGFANSKFAKPLAIGNSHFRSNYQSLVVKVLSSSICNEKELAQSNSLRELTRCADKTEIYILSLFSSLILVQKTFFVKLSTVKSFKI
jgi:hypothetical protein